jgi:hypothetical protein
MGTEAAITTPDGHRCCYFLGRYSIGGAPMFLGFGLAADVAGEQEAVVF